MPLGVVRCFGHEINMEGFDNKFLWRGGYSVCHSEGDIVTFVKEYLGRQDKRISLLLMQADGIDDIPYSDSTARRLTYNPSIFEEQRPPGEDKVILVTLCTRNTYRPNFLLLPLDDLSFTKGVYEHVSEAVTRIPWEQKIPVAFWRGISSGDIYDNLRTKAVWLLRKNPLADVKLNTPQVNAIKTGPFSDCNDAELYDGPRQPMDTFVRYKYNLVLDGACIASSLQWVFASGSVPILVTHPGNEWWFKRYLEPMKHYVPVAYDLSDLVERIEWLVSHDEEARTIAENAVAFSKHFLSAGFQQYHLENELDTVVNAV